MGLPSGYRRLEYIQSSGTQYVDTGFNPNNNSRVVLDFEPTTAYSGIVGIFGIRDVSSATAANMFIFWNNGANTFRTDYFGTQKTMTVSTLLARQTVDKDKNVTTIGSVSVSNTVSTGQCSNNLYLFCTNNAGTAQYFAKLKLYSCQIYDNGTIVRDFIPCQTTAGEIGLWDDINSVFYGNAGSGTFTAGPIVVSQSEITKLEYIQSSGTQYINSNFKANQDTRVVIDFEYISGDVVFGAYDTNGANGFGLQAAGGKWYIYYGSKGSAYSSTNVVANTRLVADLNKNVSTLNGNALMTATVNTFTGANPLIISGLYNASAPGFLTALKIYSCQIYDNGTLVRDYIPAKLSDGTVGLYDKLHGLLYINAGTGTFTAGPAVASPSIFVNINGIWKPINNIYVNINNIWQEAT